MRRHAFLTALAAAAIAPSGAHATGGLDVEASPAPQTMRILLANDVQAEAVQLDSWHFAWNGRTYRGTFAVVALDGGQMGLVNTLPLEAYLYGVVSEEVSAAWPSAAQEVQAILSRTYALGRQRPDRAFDITASESSQLYDGIEGETVEGRAAVDATAGLIVSFAGAPAEVAYSACCGGHTANAADVWGNSVPYLQGVVDPNCAGTPDYTWTITIPFATVTQALAGRAGLPDPIQRLELRDPDTSGRPRTIALIGDGITFVLPAGDFRSALGDAVLPSTLIRSASVQDTTIVLNGNGHGHGVGVCQWGARMLAQSVSAPGDILQFYLPGTSLTQT
ncbi:MAG TPA: SpoIID/LytB domain-containing protein [Candidatus Acidoferrales bacterium]|nr:SpoIID/LytB domain-containing protein [Candidatus Acidoferrales bacterium]